jgi:hypothetical protein
MPTENPVSDFVGSLTGRTQSMNSTSLAAGLIIGAALAVYLTHRHRAASHDPAHPHLPALPSPEERRERVLRGADASATSASARQPDFGSEPHELRRAVRRVLRIRQVSPLLTDFGEGSEFLGLEVGEVTHGREFPGRRRCAAHGMLAA